MRCHSSSVAVHSIHAISPVSRPSRSDPSYPVPVPPPTTQLRSMAACCILALTRNHDEIRLKGEQMEIDRRAFFASLGGAAAITAMDSEAKADALEEYMSEQLDNGAPSATSPDKKFPTVAELDAQIDTRTYRRGVGTLFANNGRNVKKLQPMPANPTLLDFFK